MVLGHGTRVVRCDTLASMPLDSPLKHLLRLGHSPPAGPWARAVRRMHASANLPHGYKQRLSSCQPLPTANWLQVRLEQARAASEELDRMFAEAAKAAAQGDRQDEEAEVGAGWWGVVGRQGDRQDEEAEVGCRGMG